MSSITFALGGVGNNYVTVDTRQQVSKAASHSASESVAPTKDVPVKHMAQLPKLLAAFLPASSPHNQPKPNLDSGTLVRASAIEASNPEFRRGNVELLPQPCSNSCLFQF